MHLIDIFPRQNIVWGNQSRYNLCEYIVGLADLDVNDYLKGKYYDLLTNKLYNRFYCPYCHYGFNSKEAQDQHLKNPYKECKKRGGRKELILKNSIKAYFLVIT